MTGQQLNMLIERVKADGVLSLMTAHLWSYSSGAATRHGRCPACKSDAFVVDTSDETYRCGGCATHGTALDLMVAMGPYPTIDAASAPVQEFYSSGGSYLDIAIATLRAQAETPSSSSHGWMTIDLAGLAESLPAMVPGLLSQGEVALLVAQKGGGKTLFAMELCARLLDGGDFLGITPEVRPLRAGWLHWDSTIARIANTAGKFGLSRNPRFLAFAGRSGDYLDETHGLANLEALIKENRLRLLVIDSLASSIQGDENSSHEMGRLGYGSVGIVERTGCTILLLHHLGKSTNSKDAGRGSSNIQGAADRILKIDVTGGRDRTMKLSVPKEREGLAVDPIKFRHVHSDHDGSIRLELLADASPAKTKRAPVSREDVLTYLAENGASSRTSIGEGITGNKRGDANNLIDAMVSDGTLSAVGRKLEITGAREGVRV